MKTLKVQGEPASEKQEDAGPEVHVLASRGLGDFLAGHRDACVTLQALQTLWHTSSLVWPL